jgi:uncharacterized delta-60 repeat protein
VSSAVAATSGSLETTFGTGGFSTVQLGTWVAAAACVVQSDGKIVTTGEANINGTNVIVSTRMMPDGSLDPTFGSNGIASFPGAGVNAITLQSDGKIVLAGVGASAVRLNPNGSMDAGFGSYGLAWAQIGTSDAANGIAIQTNGKIVFAGAATINGHIVPSVPRLVG